MRRLTVGCCEGETLVATLDEAAGRTALLIVSGGREVRSGAHRGMALLAGRLAARGTPVLRFDRRGVGDSGGSDGGYASSGPDVAAAAALLRREQPQVTHVIGFGNCDAASALALFGAEAGIDAVLLANPWVIETDGLPPAAAIRRHYRARLTDRRSWTRLLSGGIDLPKLVKGLHRIATTEPQGVADRVISAIAAWGDHAGILLASGDATAIAFADAARARGLPTPTERIATASHSFGGPGDADRLVEAIYGAIERAGGGTERPMVR